MNKHFDEVIAKLSDDPATQTTLAAILAKMISAPAALEALIGEVQASPTENTVLDRLKDLNTSLAALNFKGAVTVAHDAIAGTATSAEVDCRGYNSLLVHFASSASDKQWVISITGAMAVGGTFVPLIASGAVVSSMTTSISGYFVIPNVPDFVKVVATENADGATVTITVQPFNA